MTYDNGLRTHSFLDLFLDQRHVSCETPGGLRHCHDVHPMTAFPSFHQVWVWASYSWLPAAGDALPLFSEASVGIMPPFMRDMGLSMLTITHGP